MTTGAQPPAEHGGESENVPRYMLDFVRDNEQQHARLAERIGETNARIEAVRAELIERIENVRVEMRESESRIIRWTVGTTVAMSTLWGGILLTFINVLAD